MDRILALMACRDGLARRPVAVVGRMAGARRVGRVARAICDAGSDYATHPGRGGDRGAVDAGKGSRVPAGVAFRGDRDPGNARSNGATAGRALGCRACRRGVAAGAAAQPVPRAVVAARAQRTACDGRARARVCTGLDCAMDAWCSRSRLFLREASTTMSARCRRSSRRALACRGRGCATFASTGDAAPMGNDGRACAIDAKAAAQ